MRNQSISLISAKPNSQANWIISQDDPLLAEVSV